MHKICIALLNRILLCCYTEGADILLKAMDSFKQTQEDQTIQGQDFSQKSLAEYAFTNCLFQNCNFTECLFHNARFVSCSFKACNLSLLKMEGCRLQDVYFEGCKIMGVEFFKCEKKFFSIKAKHSCLHYCNFADLNMKHASFQECKVKECFFIDTSLIEADFTNTDLQGTTFHNSDLSKADFCGSTNYEIDLRTNKVKKAKFSFPEAIGLLRGFEIEIS